METPILEAASIPVMVDDAAKFTIDVDGKAFDFTAVSMGNPHAVTYVDDVENFDVKGVGEIIENHPLFPERTNVEFIQVISPSLIKMRVWERGSGETLACGTGACASVVSGVLNGVGTNDVTVKLLGGEVRVKWDEETNHIHLIGGAQWVFKGVYIID